MDINEIEKEPLTENFLIRLIHDELEVMPFNRVMCTRFPPEPNGYLHIGNAYAIHMNYSIAQRFNGSFHLRFDDTNPLKEDMEYVNAIIEDIQWLGYDPLKHIYYGSDYSNEIYNAAVTLIRLGKAYICDLTPEETAQYRGTLTESGRNSPFRERSIEENLSLFEGMKNGIYAVFSKVVRAKIDMSAPNINMRDPVIYRIIHTEHYRTGKDWCIYPMYDFAHPIQDAIENITYSLCSIEFKDHRPLYEWVLMELGIIEPPRQREFGRLSLTGVVTSKRFLRQLAEGGYVDGWDDPRLPTIGGLRRRGFTAESIRSFIEEIGGIRTQSTVDISLLDQSLRQHLKSTAVSVMAVLRPLKVIITNYPEGKTEWIVIENNSENEDMGNREVPFSKIIYIEQDDFLEVPSKGFHRLSLNTEVRLKGAYFIKCQQIIKDPETDEVIELHCTYDVMTKSGSGFTARKVKGTIHWVSGEHAIEADVNLFENLLLEQEIPKDDNKNWSELINPNSLVVIKNALLEPMAKQSLLEQRFHFIRHGYFCLDSKFSTSDRLVYNRIVPLKDSWKKSN